MILNYYSIQKKRQICLIGNNFKIIVDLISFKISISKKGRKIIKKFKNDIKESYFLELKDLFGRTRKISKLFFSFKTQKNYSRYSRF